MDAPRHYTAKPSSGMGAHATCAHGNISLCFHMHAQRFSLLGSTGSIGTQTLDIVKEHSDRFEIVALAAGGNVKLLAEQAWGPHCFAWRWYTWLAQEGPRRGKQWKSSSCMEWGAYPRCCNAGSCILSCASNS